MRPTFDFRLDYRPVLGLSRFDERVVGPGTALYARAATGGVRLVGASALFRPVPATRFDDLGAAVGLAPGRYARDAKVAHGAPSCLPAGRSLLRFGAWATERPARGVPLDDP